ncbi:MAG TPA: hypothetical protein VIW03_06870 [Anaeromyxobacter sp.]
MRKAVLLGALLLAAAGISWAAFSRLYPPAAGAAAAPSPAYPGGHPIDAAQVSTGKLAFQVMPPEVTGALELHSVEIVKTAEQLATKQARITGTCAPGSAIRLVEEDGTVVCQRFPRGVASVAAVAAVPRVSSTGTAQGTVPGGVGRFQTSGEDDFLVAPIELPDGALVTGFAYTFWDADERNDGAAYLYRTDDSVLAGVATQGARGEIRYAETDVVKERKVDNSAYGYFVYFQLSREAGANLMPIAASVTYRLP